MRPYVHCSVFHGGRDTDTTEVSLTEDWMRRTGCTHTVEHSSATRKDETLPFAAAWVGLENATPAEVSQTEKVKNHMLSLIRGI